MDIWSTADLFLLQTCLFREVIYAKVTEKKYDMTLWEVLAIQWGYHDNWYQWPIASISLCPTPWQYELHLFIENGEGNYINAGQRQPTLFNIHSPFIPFSSEIPQSFKLSTWISDSISQSPLPTGLANERHWGKAEGGEKLGYLILSQSARLRWSTSSFGGYLLWF